MPSDDADQKPKAQSGRRVPALAFYGYLDKYRAIFLPSLVALFLTAGLSLAFPYFLSTLIGGSAVETLRDGSDLDVGTIMEGINRTVVILLVILALQAIISYWRVRGFIKAGESALNDIRRDVFGLLVRLKVEFFERHRAGELSGRVAADLDVLRETLLTTVPALARQTVILVGGLIFIFFLVRQQ